MIKWLIVGLLLVVGPALGVESILDFESTIVLNADGSMDVTETIVVRAERNRIRRGIYRDFPTHYRDRWGNQVVVDFDLTSAKRDGQPEGYKLEKRRNGVRVYLGRSDKFLAVGQYTYTIQYRTDHQAGFFDDFDELYWNATGNGWEFSIAKARAHLTLPESIDRSQLALAAYSGIYGSRSSDVDIEVGASGTVHFETQKPLGAGQGLTIAVGFPKGIIPEPTLAQRSSRLLENNAGLALGLLGLLVVFGFYLFTWQRLGRDPDRGVIIPRYEPPEGYSPAALRYIWRRKYDTGCFSAALVNLAVKGELNIRQTSKWLSRKFSVKPLPGGDGSNLASGEGILLERLLGGRSSRLYFETKNHRRIARSLVAHEKSLTKDYGQKYFVLNRGFMSIGIMMSVVIGVMMIVVSGQISAPIVVVTGMLLLTNILFFHWLEAPTMHGRKILDHIEGLRLYLGVAERPDLERQREPLPTFQEFEKQLPYAVALDCASTWVDRFESELARLEQAGQLPQRGWLSSHGNVSVSNITSSVNSLGSSLGSAISSSSTPPGSTSGSGGSGGGFSGGGGGFSGGGGGGGGGGGW
ncbi:MAG: DUF2207 domain-containing protein [Lysobacterales bacterium]